VTTLIRSTSHGNDVSVIYIRSRDIYRKVSHSSLGKLRIVTEYEGTSWYEGQQKNLSNIKRYYSSDNYSRIDLCRIKGKHIDYNLPLTECESYLNKCIDHYINIWPKKSIVPCHGDLTLDNILFTNFTPIFFDWEHFYPQGEKWGFDIAYLIMSAAYLSSYSDRVLSNNDSLVLRSLWGKLCDNGLSEIISKQPIDYFCNVFDSSDHWRQIVDRSPHKLFPVRADKEFVQYLHRIINE
jgi:hypothetical protein